MISAQQVPLHVRGTALASRCGELQHVFELGLSDGKLFKKYRVVWVFTEGCVLGNLDDERHESFRWEDVRVFKQSIVKKIVNGAYRSTLFSMEFQLADGRELSMAGASTRLQDSKVQGFIPVASAYITRHQLPVVRQALDRGERLAFNDGIDEFFVAKDGLYCLWKKNNHLPWDRLASVDIREGFLRVYEQGVQRAWFVRAVASFPNLDAFLTLVREERALVTRRQLPVMRQALDRGERLAFDKVFVAKDGLYRPGWRKTKYLPWDRLASAKVREGFLYLYGQGVRRAWLVRAVSPFPNFDAFLTLLRELAQVEPERQTK